MRLIDADELKKRAVKVCFPDTPECGEFDAVGTGDIDIMPTIDPESLRPTAHWISVKDRLPDVFDEVLVYDTFSNTSISIAWRETTPRKNGIVDWYWNSQMSYPEDLTHVTHWMPLPEPPEVTP